MSASCNIRKSQQRGGGLGRVDSQGRSRGNKELLFVHTVPCEQYKKPMMTGEARK